MTHYYSFVDHAAVDHLWSMSWQELVKRYPTRWARSRVIRENGNYDGESLRALLAFAGDAPGDLERLLEQDMVKHTIRSCSPQLWTMGELIEHTLAKSARAVVSGEAWDATPVVRTAVRAFMDRRISARDLWAVVKLHSIAQRELGPARGATLPFKRLWDPVYAWQGPDSFKGDEWTNCLKAGDTLRFVRFLSRAHKENWPIGGGKRPQGFRESEAVAELVTIATDRVPRMTKPFVYRVWE